jgi:hypothetical protein
MESRYQKGDHLECPQCHKPNDLKAEYCWACYFNFVPKASSVPKAAQRPGPGFPVAADRPRSITIIGWYLIIATIFGLGLFFWAFQNHPELQMKSLITPTRIALLICGSVLSIVCGANILNGRNWARVLYLGWSAATILFQFKLFNLVIFLVIFFLLVTEEANRFFKPSSQTSLRTGT